MKIKVGYWETRDGRKARVLCTDALSKWPVRGYVENNGQEPSNISWKENGRWVGSNSSSADLIRPWIDRPTIDWSKERDWVKAVAMDANGEWYRYEKEPALCMDSGSWVDGGDGIQPMHHSERPKFNGNWNDSLCVRPEVKV